VRPDLPQRERAREVHYSAADDTTPWDAYEHPPVITTVTYHRRRNRCACGGSILVLTRNSSVGIDQIATAIQLHNETFGHQRWRQRQGIE
jgi:hypothetical protein